MTQGARCLEIPQRLQVSEQDLDRIAHWMQRTQMAYDLTALCRRLLAQRLRHGCELGDASRCEVPVADAVREWDPVAAWQAGDRVLLPIPRYTDRFRVFAPVGGEILKRQGRTLVVRIDGQPGTRIYGIAAKGRNYEALERWRQSFEGTAAAVADCQDPELCIDHVLWLHGRAFLSHLLAALRQDRRFVELDGDWFLRRLAIRPSTAQVLGLAREMLWVADRPLTDLELGHWMPSSEARGAAKRFGIALALTERPDLFTCIASGPHCRWVLSGPPPGPYRARYAAYDPETYVPLCEPGESLSPAVVARLWALGLLADVVQR